MVHQWHARSLSDCDRLLAVGRDGPKAAPRRRFWGAISRALAEPPRRRLSQLSGYFDLAWLTRVASRGSVVRSHRRAMSCQISSTQVVDASRGSVVRSHRRAMSCQISSIFSTRLVDPSRTSVVRSHSKVMHGPCRPHNKLALMPPPPLFQTEKQLTAPPDRPVRAPAHAVAFSTGVAAGYDRNGPGSPPPNAPSQNRPPTSPVNHMRCSADHRAAWRCDAGPDVRRAVAVCMKGTHALRAAHTTLRQPSGWAPCSPKRGGAKMILKEPHARAA